MPYDQNKDSRTGDSPGRTAFAITPSDASDLTLYAKAVYVGVTGDITCLPIDNVDGATVLYKAHPVGYMRCGVRKVLATGTTATNLLGIN